MKTILFTETVEHRFVHGAGEVPEPFNDIASSRAYPVTPDAPVPDTDLIACVWKVPAGAEMSVPDRDADRLIGLGYAQEL